MTTRIHSQGVVLVPRNQDWGRLGASLVPETVSQGRSLEIIRAAQDLLDLRDLGVLWEL